MKLKLSLIILLLSSSFLISAQSNRIEIGPYNQNNNWLLYAKPNSGRLEIAWRTDHSTNSSIWSYDWKNSLVYSTSGRFTIGKSYGFKSQHGDIGFHSKEQAKIDFYYTGHRSKDAGNLILSYGTAAGSAMLFGTNTSNGFEQLMSLIRRKKDNTALLSIKGSLHAKRVKVYVSAGADFVFDNDYNLLSLEKLEKFVSEKKHLPEIQSEKEMKEEGLNLGEMNIKLLQKIEELTLYVIQQNKEIKKLKEEMSSFKGK